MAARKSSAPHESKADPAFLAAETEMRRSMFTKAGIIELHSTMHHRFHCPCANHPIERLPIQGR